MFYLLGALFLGFNLGRNNLSNAFGTAIASRMLSKKTAAGIGAICVSLGVIFNSATTTTTVASLGEIQFPFEAFMICVSAALTMIGLTHYGIPVSLSQLTIGGFCGLLIFYGRGINQDVFKEVVKAWGLSPLISLGMSFLVFFILKGCLKWGHIRLLYRNVIARWGLMVVGGISCYALGSNNVSSILGLYAGVMPVSSGLILGLIILVLSLGFFSCSMQVIKTVGKRLFPLTPLEAFVVVVSSSSTLLLFSSKILLWKGQTVLPVAPLPTAMVLIGAVLGVSLLNGIRGIHYKVLAKILFSFIMAPFLSGMVCYTMLSMIQRWVQG